MKTCTKCGETKSLSDYGRHRNGLRSHCKACHNALASAYRLANPSRVKEIKAASYLANAEKAREYSKEYRLKNHDRVRATKSASYAANIDKIRAYSAAYYAANRKKILEAGVRWRAANPEKVRENNAAWAAANPVANRIKCNNRRARKAGGRLSNGIAEKLFKLQRGKCACCGKPLGDDYHLDHIMPLALGGTNTDNNIQLLRAECNLQKHAKHPVDYMQERGMLL